MTQVEARAGRPYMRVTPLCGTGDYGDDDYSVTFYDAQGRVVREGIIIRNANIELNGSDRLASFTVRSGILGLGDATTVRQNESGEVVIATTENSSRTKDGGRAADFIADRLNRGDSLQSVLEANDRAEAARQRRETEATRIQTRDGYRPDINPFVAGTGGTVRRALGESVSVNDATNSLQIIARLDGSLSVTSAAYRIQRNASGEVTETFARLDWHGSGEGRDFYQITTEADGTQRAVFHNYDPETNSYSQEAVNLNVAIREREENLRAIRGDGTLIRSGGLDTMLNGNGILSEAAKSLAERGLSLQEVVFDGPAPAPGQTPIEGRLSRIDETAREQPLFR